MEENQVQQLIDGESDELSVQEKREQIKEILKFEEFVVEEKPKNPCQSKHEYTNPGIKIYCESLTWGENGWEPIDNTEVLQHAPEYLPTDTAIETILEFSPILEIGAGSGYWAKVLSDAGADVIATDYLPPNVQYENLPDDYFDGVGTEKYQFISAFREEDEPFQETWHTVHVADHSCVQSYPSHTILMCHPPVGNWTEEVLEYCHLGQELVFVGEWFPGADATPLFFKKLVDNWECVRTFPVYDWASMHTGGYVFRKVDTNQH